jgi:hypothetical protein
VRKYGLRLASSARILRQRRLSQCSRPKSLEEQEWRRLECPEDCEHCQREMEREREHPDAEYRIPF